MNSDLSNAFSESIEPNFIFAPDVENNKFVLKIENSFQSVQIFNNKTGTRTPPSIDEDIGDEDISRIYIWFPVGNSTAETKKQYFCYLDEAKNIETSVITAGWLINKETAVNNIPYWIVFPEKTCQLKNKEYIEVAFSKIKSGLKNNRISCINIRYNSEKDCCYIPVAIREEVLCINKFELTESKSFYVGDEVTLVWDVSGASERCIKPLDKEVEKNGFLLYTLKGQTKFEIYAKKGRLGVYKSFDVNVKGVLRLKSYSFTKVGTDTYNIMWNTENTKNVTISCEGLEISNEKKGYLTNQKLSTDVIRIFCEGSYGQNPIDLTVHVMN